VKFHFLNKGNLKIEADKKIAEKMLQQVQKRVRLSNNSDGFFCLALYSKWTFFPLDVASFFSSFFVFDR